MPVPAPAANANAESGLEVVNHEEFADVNGSGYKLEQPLGGSSQSLGAGQEASMPTTEKTQDQSLHT